jgi:hypothetical protein
MKKLLIAIVAVVFSSAVLAQAPASTPEKKAEMKPAMEKMSTHCYAMKDGAMTHCMGTKGEPMSKDVTLKNGTMVSTKGEITTKDGKKSMLANGQCIDVNGKVGDFDKMHPGMKKDSKSKM